MVKLYELNRRNGPELVGDGRGEKLLLTMIVFVMALESAATHRGRSHYRRHPFSKFDIVALQLVLVGLLIGLNIKE